MLAGHLVEGFSFHKYYFDIHSKKDKGKEKKKEKVPQLSHIASPKVIIEGDIAVVSYTRLVQSKAHKDKAGLVTAYNETRIWQRKQNNGGNYEWKNIHFHRSFAPSL